MLNPKQQINPINANLEAEFFVIRKQYSKTITIPHKKTMIWENGFPTEKIANKGNSNVMPVIRRLISGSLSLINFFFRFLFLLGLAVR